MKKIALNHGCKHKGWSEVSVTLWHTVVDMGFGYSEGQKHAWCYNYTGVKNLKSVSATAPKRLECFWPWYWYMLIIGASNQSSNVVIVGHRGELLGFLGWIPTASRICSHLHQQMTAGITSDESDDGFLIQPHDMRKSIKIDGNLRCESYGFQILTLLGWAAHRPITGCGPLHKVLWCGIQGNL